MYEQYHELATKVRAHCCRMVHLGKSGHIGSMLSAADIMAVLYSGVLNVDPQQPRKEDRDRFILSKGHAGAVVYATLAEKGFFPREWLDTYYQDDGKLMGHISHYVPGVEFSTGSLGHGLPVAVGMALDARHRGRTHRVFCMLSDGDMNEGSTWEAIMFAGQHHLDNLVCITGLQPHTGAWLFQGHTRPGRCQLARSAVWLGLPHGGRARLRPARRGFCAVAL